MIIGVGCDIVEIKRIAALDETFAKRVLSEEEFALYETYNDARKLEFLAGRFAAKEAIVKAMDKEILISQISITYEHNKPVCHMEGYSIHVSIAHEKDYAVAYAICEK